MAGRFLFLKMPRRGKDLPATAKVLVLLDVAAAEQADGKLPRGTWTLTAAKFNVSHQQVAKLWRAHGHHARVAAAARPVDHDALAMHLQSRRGIRGGRRPREKDAVQAVVASLRYESRATYRSTEFNSGIPASSLHRYVKSGVLKTATSSIKPAIKEGHKARRIGFCLEQLIQSYVSDSDVPSFSFPAFEDIVHVDEKIFRVDKIRRKYLLAPGESPPPRATQNKRHIAQLMFLAAVAKPRRVGNTWWDGKLGIWSFAVRVAAQRSSPNRPRGTPVLTAVSVTAEVYLDMLETKLRPALLAKWPRNQPVVQVQQDNAPAHPPAGPWFCCAGLTVSFVCQPAQSPDLNVLDLGYFSAIQALQQQRRTKTLEELVVAVEESFVERKREALENVFYTWAACMEQVMLNACGNQYKIPHLKKDQIRKELGHLPSTYSCSLLAVSIAELALLDYNSSV